MNTRPETTQMDPVTRAASEALVRILQRRTGRTWIVAPAARLVDLALEGLRGRLGWKTTPRLHDSTEVRMQPQPTVILDFIHSVVINVGATQGQDRAYQEFLTQQQQQLTAQGHPPKSA
jgi:hypothetical protein